jgi:intracellular septation protein
MKKAIKFLSEFGPGIAFFVFYKLYGIIPATTALIITSALSFITLYLIDGKVPLILVVTTGIVIFMGIITICTENPIFIKMKPTILNFAFFLILYIGALFKKGLLKYVFEKSFKLSEQSWLNFSKRWSFYFLFSALLNEVIWRNFSEDFWVNYKVFGSLITITLFMLSQMKFLKEHTIVDNDNALIK